MKKEKVFIASTGIIVGERVGEQKIILELSNEVGLKCLLYRRRL